MYLHKYTCNMYVCIIHNTIIKKKYSEHVVIIISNILYILYITLNIVYIVYIKLYMSYYTY